MNLIFWLFVIFALAALSIPFIVLFIIGRRSRLLQWLAAIPAAVFLTLAGLVLFSFIRGIVHPYADTTNKTTIRQSFVENFDFQPDSDFVPLHQRIFGIEDTGRMYLQFKSAPATFERIRLKKFEIISQSEFFLYTGGPNAPPWWVQTSQSGGVYYKNADWKGPFHANQAYLFYQPESNLVYFCNEGSD